MCGILGEVSFNKQLSSKKVFLSILEKSVKRGPDYQGFNKVDQFCQLGHNRLSILDLSSNGNQPIASPSGRFVMVYNGEIYNHQDIRSRIPKDYYRFKGNSDTETLIVALEFFGIEQSISLLDGMFALGIYDRETQSLTLARDFAGIKPLFYGLDGKSVVFASQYDQVVSYPSFQTKSIRPETLRLYLQQHFLPAPFGLYEDTAQLRPGEIIQFNSASHINRKRYWTFPVNQEYSFQESSQALHFIEQELTQAVSAELLSDVPVGAFLSGGIDSPLVCAISQSILEKPLNTFTIGSDSKIHDESKLAEQYANLLGVSYHLEQMDSSKSLAFLDKILTSVHEPIADLSIIPTYLVSKLAAQTHKVALSGDGGDELFFGYERFASIAKNLSIQSLPYALKYLIYGSDRLLFRNKHFNSAALAKTTGIAHQGLHSRFATQLLDEIAPDLKGLELPTAFDIYQYPCPQTELELLQYMRQAEFYGMMQKTLRKVDLASMENSLEVRVPFLKKSFIEATLQIDPYLSFGLGRKKEILKQLLKRRLPRSPIDNIKRGFSIPLSQWLREDLKIPFHETLLNEKLISHFGFRKEGIESILQEHDLGIDRKWPLFTLFTLFKWQEQLLR